mmetsp:Transcript_18585/g.53361  ORF Transcript_18585/g.53361 Transcript_18585/m.53361 type:complete len:155 (-) Transcript_18585:1332-1796(-)
MARMLQVLAAILGCLQRNVLAFVPVAGVRPASSVSVSSNVSIFHQHASFAGSSLTSSALAARRDGPQFGDSDYNGDPTGLKRGAIILPFALLINIWMFSIPVEYRRARICSEEQVRDNPGSKCMTTETWRSGVADYYANGGGIKFDFSIDPDSK